MKQDVRKEISIDSHPNVRFVRQIVDRVDNWLEFVRGSDAGNEDATVGGYKDKRGQTPGASKKTNGQLSIFRKGSNCQTTCKH